MTTCILPHGIIKKHAINTSIQASGINDGTFCISVYEEATRKDIRNSILLRLEKDEVRHLIGVLERLIA